MNPEIMYPEIKTMKDSEVFVEGAYITKKGEVTKIHVKIIIAKRALDTFRRVLQEEHHIEDIEDVKLITISR